MKSFGSGLEGRASPGGRGALTERERWWGQLGAAPFTVMSSCAKPQAVGVLTTRYLHGSCNEASEKRILFCWFSISIRTKKRIETSRHITSAYRVEVPGYYPDGCKQSGFHLFSLEDPFTALLFDRLCCYNSQVGPFINWMLDNGFPMGTTITFVLQLESHKQTNYGNDAVI